MLALPFGTAGCNLTCKLCRNWDNSTAGAMDRLTDLASPEAIVDAAAAIGARTKAYTHDDPVILLE
jgi:pyruvate formate lyase activating enzyme